MNMLDDPELRAAAASAATPAEFLSFRVGAEEYGIDILRVQEIRSYEPPMRIANAPAFVKGLINLRGVIVPVVDLRLTLGCERADYDEATVVIVIHALGRVIGVVVDAVSDVLPLARDQIRPAPEMRSGIACDAITGIGCLSGGEADRMLILLDIEALMGNVEMGLVGSSLH